jgi:NitT/TauT family transport system substrate-binding protein
MADYFVAKDKGYYADEGIDIEILEGKGSGPTLEAVASGHTDIADASCAQMALADGEGRDLVAIGMRNARPSFGFFVDEGSPIDSIASLKGKELVMSPGTLQAALTPAIFDKVGVDMAADVRVLSVQAAQQLSTYAQGQGDALATSVPYGAALVDPKRPSTKLMWADEGFQMPDFCFVVTNETLKSKPDLLKGFLTATYKGRADAHTDPQTAVDAMAAVYPQIDKAVLLRQLTDHLQFDCTSNMTRLGTMDADAWSAGVDTLKEYAKLPASVEADSLYTDELINSIDTPACWTS